MSQNKTIIPGVDYGNLGKAEYDANALDDMYKRSSEDINRTYIAGSPAEAEVPQGAASAPGGMSTGVSRQFTMQDRVVVGCLFSMSRGMLGEIFPLYLGKNIIGSAPNCDVCLMEETVSPAHAILHIRKDGYPSAFRVTITDFDSEYGTAVNKNDGRYETLSVNENDVITIGLHYNLLVKLFDTDAHGLNEDPDFKGMPAAQGQDMRQAGAGAYGQEPPSVSNDFYTPTRDGEDSTRTVIY